MTFISIIILIIDILLKEEIGFGTIIDAVLTGNLVKLFTNLNPLSTNESTILGIFIMLLGFVFMALGIMVYMKAGMGCGPRDALLVGLGKRMPKVPIGVVEIILWAIVVLSGWILGGPVGIGTVLSTFLFGSVMQALYIPFKFEPRDIDHKNVLETIQELKKGYKE